MDPDEPLAGTWKINDTPTMTGWDFLAQSKGIGKGPVYFTITDGQEVYKYQYIDVFRGDVTDHGDTEDQPLYVNYWPLGGTGTKVYDSSTGIWAPAYAQTITIMSIKSDREYIAAWLNANATKIS